MPCLKGKLYWKNGEGGRKITNPKRLKNRESKEKKEKANKAQMKTNKEARVLMDTV